MKSRETILISRSLRDLKALLKKKAISLPYSREVSIPLSDPPSPPEEDDKLFHAAMEGVVPMPRDEEAQSRASAPTKHPVPGFRMSEREDGVAELRDLVEKGNGFHIVDTPEYVEGTGYNVRPDIARRLHQGHFSIQAHLDLHGFGFPHALQALEKFFRWAVFSGKRGVLIIHGRGLSSPAEPVLKSKVIAWLTRGPWRKWIIAYASARLCDGGAGATYVLLRARPVSKREKVKRGN